MKIKIKNHKDKYENYNIYFLINGYLKESMRFMWYGKIVGYINGTEFTSFRSCLIPKIDDCKYQGEWFPNSLFLQAWGSCK